MTATVKVPNYTEAQVTELVKAYVESPTKATVEAFATKFGKTARSIVAKLAKENVYVSKAKEAGKREMLKAEMVSKIAEMVGKNEEQMESLEKATGPALMAVLHALEAAQPAVETEE
jgi:NAD(P)H-dependent flavin oxidoreductase YrpB (nitropropane dioxygenase family)